MAVSIEKGAQHIVDDIIGEAKQKSAKIINAAKDEAKTVLDTTHKNAKEREKAAVKKAHEQGKQIRDQLLAEGRMKAKREKLRKREELLNEVFKKSERLLKKHASSKEYGKNLVHMTVSAYKKLGSDEAVIRVNRRDLEILEKEKKKLAEEIGEKVVLGDPVKTMGGVMVETPDGKIVIDETFESRMKREFDPLRIKVAKILFEGSK